jgi:L-lactate oxidase
MITSRRRLMHAVGAGAVLAAAPAASVPAQQQAAPLTASPGFGNPSTAEAPLKIVNIELLEDQAKTILSPGRFAITGWQGDGWTYRENRRAFNDYPIAPRRLQGVSDEAIDLSTAILGHKLPLPMITCPMGGHGNFHEKAEAATAAGTGAAGTLYTSSGASNLPMEDIAKATPGPKWFQIYMNRDMEINRWLVQRAKAAGFTAIVLTADALGPGQSDAYIALGRPTDPALGPGNHDPARGGRGNFRDMKRDLSFSDITFLHEASGLPVIAKGVVNPEDVKQSIAAGAAAIWVSNHGGRQIDGVPGSITMLRPAVDAVAGRVPIVFDSGIRRGIDVYKAVSMGATVVAVGRPVLWGLTCGGSAGVKSVYDQLKGELRAAMLLGGVAKVTDLKRDNVVLAKA